MLTVQADIFIYSKFHSDMMRQMYFTPLLLFLFGDALNCLCPFLNLLLTYRVDSFNWPYNKSRSRNSLRNNVQVRVDKCFIAISWPQTSGVKNLYLQISKKLFCSKLVIYSHIIHCYLNSTYIGIISWIST